MPGHTFLQVGGQLVDGKTDLGHGIAVAYRYRLIFQCLVIDSYAVGCTDLVLAAIAATNTAYIVVLCDHQPLQALIDGPGSIHQFLAVPQQWEYSDLYWCQHRV